MYNLAGMFSLRLLSSLFFLGLITSVKGWFWNTEVCYGSLGCFSTAFPYTNTRLLPRNPEQFDIQFLLLTRENPEEPKKLKLSKDVRTCTWNTLCRKSAGVKIIIHGYWKTYRQYWITDMVEALLQHDDYNIILLDYEAAAFEVLYHQSVANARVVGAQLAEFIQVLERFHDIDLQDVHLIGHSLGAHIAGYAGERLSGLGRITGLDPAGPAFENYGPKVRLDPTDAQFVDVIHTDAESLLHFGLGLKQAIGTVDFYPNGGKDQPGCPSTHMEHFTNMFSRDMGAVYTFGCSHLRAPEFFTASINNDCSFTAYPCDVISSASQLVCTSCGRERCPTMGFYTRNDSAHGKYYLRTGSEAPFC